MRTSIKENETFILEVKKHWIVFIKPVAVICSFVWMKFAVGGMNLYSHVHHELLFKKYLLWGTVFSIAYFVYVYLDRKYDIWAVTDQRVVDESGIITHRAKESPIEKINNVDVIQTLIGRIMGYGKVRIQTAATEGESWINFVERPVELQTTILKQIEEFNIRQKTDVNVKETKECPFCAETILQKAKVCKHCGRELPTVAGDGIILPAGEKATAGHDRSGHAEQNGRPLGEEASFVDPFSWKRSR